MMRLLFPLLGHLLVTLARLARPGGVRAVVAESLAVKHQLLIMKRSQRRAPNLTSWDRGFDAGAPSSGFGEAQISSSIWLQSTPSPGAERSLQRADCSGGRDETAQPTFGLA